MLPIRSKSFSVGVLLVLALAFGLGAAKTATAPPPAERIYDMQWLDINKWYCPFYNDGRYALDITIGTGEAGGAWPQPFNNKYIFGAGLWFGTLKPRVDDPDKVDTLVTFGYNPNSGGTEMTPTDAAHASEGAGALEDRIYKFPGTWPPPLSRYTSKGWRFGASRRDTVEAELVPQENFSLQDMWCVYCDLGEDNHVSPGQPQGIEVYQTVYAWNYPSNEDIFFIIYKIRNATDILLGNEGVTLQRCFAGALMDPDIGVHSDDMVGLLLNDSVAMPNGDTIVVKNVGFAGDLDNHEEPNARQQWQEGTPGVVAYKFLESPLKDSVLPSGEDTLVPLGMTSFKKFTIDIDPVTDPTQYLTMAGFDYRTGVLSNYDSIDDTEADKRFVQCSGPFDLAPGQVEVLIVACIAARFGEENEEWEPRRAHRYNDELWELAAVANNAQFIYDQGWLLPGPPPSPNIKLVPSDNSIRIVWDNMPEREPDPYYRKVASNPESPGYDPKYLEYDFQGYVVYKSSDGSEWDLMTQCDIGDEIPAETTLVYPPGGDSSLPDSMWLELANTGLFYNVLDEDVVNGFNYYYSVTAYDWNYVTTEKDSLGNPIAWDTLILRSGIVSNYFTMPRWDPVNYVDPIVEVVTMKGDSTAPAMTWYPQVVVPFDVTDDVYRVTFLGPTWTGSSGGCGTGYLLENTSDEDTTVDTVRFNYTVGDTYAFSAGVFNGVELACTLNIELPDNAHDSVWIESTSGNYPEESLKVSVSFTTQAAWAYRGSDYKIVWTDEPGYMTARVYDMSKGEMMLPFKPFLTRGTGPQDAEGWCFANKLFGHPTDSLWDTTAQLYICGGYIALFDSAGRGLPIGSNMYEIKSGDVWMVKGNKDGGTAPYYNVYEVQATPGREDMETEREFEVKVVPNPYIVFDAWESNSEERVVKFTHLPSQATIRIFTLSGDLVKVIEHHHASEDQEFEYGGTANWDFLNDNNQLIAAGVYVYHVQSDVGEYTGKLVFIH